jgi:hypothetical protein
MANKNSRYTYVNFANDVIRITNGETLTAEELTRIREKAGDLLTTQNNKAEYNKANPKKATAKGASEATQANANAIGAILPNDSDNAMTAADINTALGTEFTALQVANAVKFIDGATSTKVIRETVNGKGLKAEREYTAYFRA